jgi:uncharacterized protein YndB with AHSA1/START domain
MKNTLTAKVTAIFNAPIEKIWDALTNPELVKQYFFGTKLVADWKVGGTIYFRGVWEDKPYEDKGLVQTYEANKTLSYLYRSSWDTLPDVLDNYLLVTYTVEKTNEGTQLTITQQSATEEKAKDSENNWNGIMEGMRKVVEA